MIAPNSPKSIPSFISRKCDFKECSKEEEDFAVLRGCGHSYHLSCIAVSGICIICFSVLETAIKELVKTANDAIFNPRWKNKDNKDDTDSTGTPSNDDNEDLCGQIKVEGDNDEALEMRIRTINNQVLELK